MGVAPRADVVVIGSGAGGAAAAWRLADHGAHVLVIEAGPRFIPSRDYPQDTAGWERRRFPVKPGSQGAVTYGDLGVAEPEFADLQSWSRAGLPDIVPAGAPRRNLGYSHVQGVGGSTLHFVGEAHRLHPDAFRLRSITGRGADWPIGYDDLEPYYTLAENRIGVAGDNTPTDRRRSAPYPQAAHPRSPGATALARYGAALGQTWEVNPRAALSEARPGRGACNYCGVCSRGCPLGDKGSADVTYLRDGYATGRLTIWENTQALRLILGAGGRVAAVELARAGAILRVDTPEVIVAGGAVQTPRLLLLSAAADVPEGLANGSGQLGRNFHETLSWRSTALVPDIRNSHMGLPADAIWWGASAPVAGGTGGYRLSHTTIETGFNGPVAYATRLVDGIGRDFKAALRRDFGTAVSINAVGQVISDDRSHVTLDEQVRDAFDRPAARIASVLTRPTLGLLHEMATAARAVLGQSGGTIVEEGGSWDSFSAPHVFGTARMGRDSGTSVVDGTGRSHDHANLWIADASVFPTSGGGEAPSLTINAHAMRLADTLLAG